MGTANLLPQARPAILDCPANSENPKIAFVGILSTVAPLLENIFVLSSLLVKHHDGREMNT